MSEMGDFRFVRANECGHHPVFPFGAKNTFCLEQYYGEDEYGELWVSVGYMPQDRVVRLIQSYWRLLKINTR